MYKAYLRGNGEALSKNCDALLLTHASKVPGWYAACTKPCHEKRVAEHLRLRGVELFLPVCHSERRWRNGLSVTLERPLFPGYVFVRIPASERLRVLELSSVVSIVGNGRTPVPLPDEEIARLRAGLPFVKAQPHPLLTAGETARICRGPLEGLTGIVTRQKNNLRVVLTLDLIMKSVAVEVSMEDIEPVAKARQTTAFAAVT